MGPARLGLRTVFPNLTPANNTLDRTAGSRSLAAAGQRERYALPK